MGIDGTGKRQINIANRLKEARNGRGVERLNDSFLCNKHENGNGKRGSGAMSNDEFKT